MDLIAVVLAAGQGKRMQSDLPKVLHPVGGQPMLLHVLNAAFSLDPSQCIVVHATDAAPALRAATSALHHKVQWVEQPSPKGTGHAVACALETLTQAGRVLVLYGDVPLIEPETLAAFIAHTPKDAVGVITMVASDPTGLGRIVRNGQGEVVEIVEHKDATEAQRAIQEVNTGIFCLSAEALRQWLPQLACDNAQQEYYLTDIIALAVAQKTPVVGMPLVDTEQVLGVNNRRQWTQAEQTYQRRKAWEWVDKGVHIADPARLTIRGNVQLAKDAFCDVGVVLEGDVVIETGARIGPYVHLKDTTVGAGATVLTHTVSDGASIAAGARVGPFARLRPGAQVGTDAMVGNFVEVKKASIGSRSKVSHLSYVGDATIEADVNIGAGTIFCNYDGINKHHTTVQEGAFIGSGSELVAPVTVGSHATVGAGTTVTKDVPPDTLCIRRAKQQNIEGWQRPVKAKENNEG
jgi:bifunctional UDP-N-acetylglucosamine pyrophosphorylase/glucosamine-1-phosphate N-acetyltransferase